MASLGEIIDNAKFEKASVMIVQLLNRILYGKEAAQNRYRQKVREFESMNSKCIENARTTIFGQDFVVLAELGEILQIKDINEHNSAQGIFDFLVNFGKADSSDDTEATTQGIEKQHMIDAHAKEMEQMQEVVVSLQQQISALMFQLNSKEKPMVTEIVQPGTSNISMFDSNNGTSPFFNAHENPIDRQLTTTFVCEENVSSVIPTSSERSTTKHDVAPKHVDFDGMPKQLVAQSGDLFNVAPKQDVASIPEKINNVVPRQNDILEDSLSSESTPSMPSNIQQQLPSGANSCKRKEQYERQSRAPTSFENNSTNSQFNNIQKILTRQIMGTELPKFGGDVMEWPAFITEYSRSTEEGDYSASENMKRLRQCLTGNARKCVEMMLFTNDADRVISILRKNFGKSDMVVDKLIEKINSILPVTTSKSFLEFSNFVENLSMIIENFGDESFLNHHRVLVKQLIQKLPNYLRIQCANYMTQNKIAHPTVNNISDWADQEHDVISLFEIGEGEISTKTYGMEQTTSSLDTGKIQSSASMHQAVEKNEFMQRYKCVLCQDDQHPLDKCAVFVNANVNDRWSLARRARSCFTCLKRHRNGSCSNRVQCGVNDCNRYHHRLLHNSVNFNQRPVISSALSVTSSGVILKMVPVKVKGPKGELDIVAFLDEGSTVTMIDSEVARIIGAEGPVVPLCCMWTGDISRNDENSQQVAIELTSSTNNNKTFKLTNVRTFEKLQLPKQLIDIDALYKNYPYTKEAHFGNQQPQLLIGQDNCDLIVSRDSVQPKPESPMLTLTKLGWVVHGPAAGVRIESEKIVSLILCRCEENMDNLHEFVKNQMTLENFGVTVPNVDRRKSDEDRRALCIAETSIKKINDRYEISLPYKNDDIQMISNYSTAYHRLKCTEKKVLKDGIGTAYNDTVKSFVDKGYAVKLNADDVPISKNNLWFLPHFPVINVNKPGKIRLVFDAAAKTDGFCLNDYLLTGPDLVPSLFGILSRFREQKIGICADIMEMFPQVRIVEDDSWSQCFLWRDLSTFRTPDIYKMNAMTFGATSSPFMAQFVKNYNAEQHREQYPEAAAAIINQHYVDDFIESVETEDTAISLITDVTNIHRNAGFNIRGFVSNSLKVLDSFPNEKVAENTISLFAGVESHRVLGVRWDTSIDKFVFHYDFHQIPKCIIDGVKVPTKREVLKVAMSVFDPIGFITPITITSRILLQQIWKSGIGWDDEIQPIVAKKWFDWLKNLQCVETLAIPRCYSQQKYDTSKIQLHIFCDASESAYSAVAYLRIESTNKVEIVFVASKARVSPIRMITIPKLELLAAVLGTRLAQLIRKELRIPISETIFWSDSKTVILWIQSTKKLISFVSTRVGEILECTSEKDWNWVPTKVNPADIATRENYTELTDDSKWIVGPEFLSLPREDWPTLIDNTEHDVSKNDAEINEMVILNIQTNSSCSVNHLLSDCLPNPKNFSSYTKLLRSTIFVKRAIHNYFHPNSRLVNEFSPEEYEWAEDIWIKSEQQNFPTDFEKQLKSFSIYKDDNNILRAGGRLNNADVSYSTKNPIILKGKTEFVKLLVMHHHVKAFHQGRETVLNNLKQRYYFPQMRSVVKSIIHGCQRCVVRRSLPKPQISGQLPKYRVTSNLPVFTYVGLDYFGPLLVHIGRRQEKRWGAIFTCLASRAVHIELTSSLSTDNAIMVLRRFQARRGTPKVILSDNGTNFRGAETELQKALCEIDHIKIKESLSLGGTSWQFIPPASPHFGGSWERLIRIIKTALYEVLNEKVPKEETLHTFLVEIENLVNSRPITFVSTDPMDPQSLTPNMLLRGNDENIISPGRFEKRDEYLRKQWRISQHWIEMFWQRWVKDYVIQLLPRKKWFKQYPNVQVGDVVKILQEDTPRGYWPLGRIIKVFPGTDDVVRVVQVMTKNGIIKRPITKVVPIVMAEGEEAISCIDKQESIRGEEM